MSVRELPILQFARFRVYPAKRDQQTFDDETQVCTRCLAGACCSSEHPIALRNFDVRRLAAFFNMSPESFLLRFTQERFRDEKTDEVRERFIADLNCSIVTYLRRRENSPTSPCIFLKYVNDPDGTPRRICSVHEARPLACREFYFDTCKKRVTGELAGLLAEGYEKLRDGEITEALAESHLSAWSEGELQTMSMSEAMQHSFWVEMKRAANADRANYEGANSYDMAVYQDPIEQKMNRLLSKKHHQLEKRLGTEALADLVESSGPTFTGSNEHQRIMKILNTPPSKHGLFSAGDYRPNAGVRTLFPGMKAADVFATIPSEETSRFVDALPRVPLFPNHDLSEVRVITLAEVYGAVLSGYNHLIRFASYFAAMGDVIEEARPGEFACQMLTMIAGFQTSLNAFLAKNPYFDPVKYWLAENALAVIAADLASAASLTELLEIFGLLSGIRRAVPLSGNLGSRFKLLTTGVQAMLSSSAFDPCALLDNPVMARLAAGKRLDSKRAWAAWRGRLLHLRNATIAGIHCMDLTAFYEQTVNDLEKIHFRKSLGLEIYNVVHQVARSICLHNTVPDRNMPYKHAADRLAAYAVRLFKWMEETSYKNHDCEIIAGFPSVYRMLGRSYNHDPSFGLITYRLLEAQAADGSWNTNPVPLEAPAGQSQYLETLYRGTWECVDALRPIRTDAINIENASLGLV